MTPIRLLLLLSAIAALPAAASEGVGAKQLSGWRGDGSGCYPDANPAVSWSASKNVRWSATVGMSYSSPILGEQQVLVTAEPNLLICLSAAPARSAGASP